MDGLYHYIGLPAFPWTPWIDFITTSVYRPFPGHHGWTLSLHRFAGLSLDTMDFVTPSVPLRFLSGSPSFLDFVIPSVPRSFPGLSWTLSLHRYPGLSWTLSPHWFPGLSLSVPFAFLDFANAAVPRIFHRSSPGIPRGFPGLY